jgi:hypothetical protein
MAFLGNGQGGENSDETSRPLHLEMLSEEQLGLQNTKIVSSVFLVVGLWQRSSRQYGEWNLKVMIV